MVILVRIYYLDLVVSDLLSWSKLVQWMTLKTCMSLLVADGTSDIGILPDHFAMTHPQQLEHQNILLTMC